MPEPKINTSQMKKQLFRFLTQRRGVAAKNAKLLVSCVFAEVEKGKQAKRILNAMGIHLDDLSAEGESSLRPASGPRGVVLRFRRS